MPQSLVKQRSPRQTPSTNGTTEGATDVKSCLVVSKNEQNLQSGNEILRTILSTRWPSIQLRSFSLISATTFLNSRTSRFRWAISASFCSSFWFKPWIAASATPPPATVDALQVHQGHSQTEQANRAGQPLAITILQPNALALPKTRGCSNSLPVIMKQQSLAGSRRLFPRKRRLARRLPSIGHGSAMGHLNFSPRACWTSPSRRSARERNAVRMP